MTLSGRLVIDESSSSVAEIGAAASSVVSDDGRSARLSKQAALVDDLARLSGGAQWGLHLGVGPCDPVSVEARLIELGVMSETYGVTVSALAASAEAAEPASIWALILNYDARCAIGSMRIVGGDPAAWEFSRDLDNYWRMTFAESCAKAGCSPALRFAEGGSFSILPVWRPKSGGWPTKLLLAAYVHLVEELSLDATMQTANPGALRVAERFGVQIVRAAPARAFGGIWGTHRWQPAIAPSRPAHRWLRAQGDDEMEALILDRHTGARGGTRLPGVDEWAAARRAFDQLAER